MFIFFKLIGYILTIGCAVVVIAAVLNLILATYSAFMVSTQPQIPPDGVDRFWECGVLIYGFQFLVFGVPGLILYLITRWWMQDGSAKKSTLFLCSFPQFAALVATIMFILGALKIYYR